MKLKHFSQRELKYLAENLTNTQVAFLMEGDSMSNTNIQQNDINAQQQNLSQVGSAAPKNWQAGLDSNNQQQTQQNQQNKANTSSQISVDNKKINGISDFLTKGYIDNIPVKTLSDKFSQWKISESDAMAGLNKFVMSSAEKVIAAHISGVIKMLLYLKGKQFEFGQEINLSLQNFMKGYGDLISSVKKFKAGTANQENESLIYKYGERLFDSNLNESLDQIEGIVKMIKNSRKLNESSEYYLNSISDNILSVKGSGILGQIDEYYKINKKLNKITSILEFEQYNLKDYKDGMAKFEDRRKQLNENLSAAKFAVSFYKQNKQK